MRLALALLSFCLAAVACTGGSTGQIRSFNTVDPCHDADEESCLADDRCQWFEIGAPCIEGEPCISGVCQYRVTDEPCACECAACEADKECPPCECSCPSDECVCSGTACPEGDQDCVPEYDCSCPGDGGGGDGSGGGCGDPGGGIIPPDPV